MMHCCGLRVCLDAVSRPRPILPRVPFTHVSTVTLVFIVFMSAIVVPAVGDKPIWTYSLASANVRIAPTVTAGYPTVTLSVIFTGPTSPGIQAFLSKFGCGGLQQLFDVIEGLLWVEDLVCSANIISGTVGVNITISAATHKTLPFSTMYRVVQRAMSFDTTPAWYVFTAGTVTAPLSVTDLCPTCTSGTVYTPWPCSSSLPINSVDMLSNIIQNHCTQWLGPLTLTNLALPVDTIRAGLGLLNSIQGALVIRNCSNVSFPFSFPALRRVSTGQGPVDIFMHFFQSPTNVVWQLSPFSAIPPFLTAAGFSIEIRNNINFNLTNLTALVALPFTSRVFMSNNIGP
eukprot:m.174602 g.174602  ORF g.174602 m.174602 type:complete len:344 (+) comp15323_c0_seq1:1017-2048(+)